MMQSVGLDSTPAYLGVSNGDYVKDLVSQGNQKSQNYIDLVLGLLQCQDIDDFQNFGILWFFEAKAGIFKVYFLFLKKKSTIHNSEIK